MNRLIKLLALLLIAVIFTPADLTAKKQTSKKREEIILGQNGHEYGYKLNSPAAAMVIEFTTSTGRAIRDEHIFNDTTAFPAMRLLSETKGNWMQVDTITYNEAGRIIRVGHLHKPKNKERVELFGDSGWSYTVGYVPPTGNRYNQQIRLTDFDSHGNWTKAYYVGEKKPIVRRTITYSHSPEQLALLEKNSDLIADAQKEMDSTDLFVTLFFVFCGVVCLAFCILGLCLKSAWNGKLRWLLLLIFGIPLASIAFYGLDDVLKPLLGAYRTVYYALAIALYMWLMWVSVKAMSYDRRLSNSFIETIVIIWSIWACFVLCSSFMSSILPNFWGWILRFFMGIAIWLVYYYYLTSRCPVCHAPHGMVFDHQTIEGVRAYSSTSGSRSRGKSKVRERFGSSMMIDTPITDTETTTTDIHEVYRNHYRCNECGHTTHTGLLKGALLSRNIQRTTRKSTERTWIWW